MLEVGTYKEPENIDYTDSISAEEQVAEELMMSEDEAGASTYSEE